MEGFYPHLLPYVSVTHGSYFEKKNHVFVFACISSIVQKRASTEKWSNCTHNQESIYPSRTGNNVVSKHRDPIGQWCNVISQTNGIRRSSRMEYCIAVHIRGADKSLARPGRKQVRKLARDARDFNNIETRDVIKFLFLQCKAPKEIHAILTATLPCFLPGRAKDLSASLYA